MRRSDIFESFVKIAKEKGLISTADHAEHTEKDFHETNPRHDSLTIEQINKLYNTKSNKPKDMEYKKNIMEDAHPDSVVLSPAHDKLNGLVENEIEGQNIRMRIVMKTPDGHLTQRKYAQQQLLLSLIRTANDLDNRNQDELRKLADVCLEQASEMPMTKQAIAPLVIAGVAAIATLLGALYAKQHLNFHSDGFEQDYQKAIKEIDDLLESNESFQTKIGAGYTYTPEFISMLNDLKAQLSKLEAVVQKVLPVLNNLEKPKTGTELKEMAGQPIAQEISQSLSEYKAVYEEIEPFVETVMANFRNEGFKQRSIVQKGWLSSMIDSAEILHGGWGLMSDDFDDVSHSLGALEKDMANIATGLKRYENATSKIMSRLTEAKAQTSQTFGSEPSKSPGILSSLEEEAQSLIGGHK